MSWYRGWAPYVPVAKKIANGHAAAKRLAAKEKRDPQPVRLTGRKFANTFWGQKWCENLERYSDFANRLPRGATYVRNGSVADLVIEPGVIRAIVGGSEAYKIRVEIAPLPTASWQALVRECAQSIESLFDLLQGKFDAGVMARLTRAQDGLFPQPRQIKMRCSCPDYAGVCKHIAATFYGVAHRLDTKPELLFTLRKVDHLELIGSAVSRKNLDRALAADGGSKLVAGDLGEIFGIELETNASQAKPTRRKARPAAASAPPASRAGGRPRKGAAVQAPVSATKPARTKRRVATVAKAVVAQPTAPPAPTRGKVAATKKGAVAASPKRKGAATSEAKPRRATAKPARAAARRTPAKPGTKS